MDYPTNYDQSQHSNSQSEACHRRREKGTRLLNMNIKQGLRHVSHCLLLELLP